MQIQEDIKNFLLSNGVADVGFTKISNGDFGDNTYAVSIVVKLSDAIINEISDEPTHSYFHHYRTVNSFIDRICLQVGFMLERAGFSYIAVAASQSINKDGWNYKGRFSHKEAASLADLGGIGKNCLFLHKEYGPRVRLGTVLTNCHFEVSESNYESPCIGCDACVKACPSGAIKGKIWKPGMEREEVFNPEECSEYMKRKFQKIGRGAVCGICMRVCPIGGCSGGTSKD